MITAPSIRLHFGASHDDITVDGHTFIRHQLTKKEFSFLRNVVIDTLIKVGAINRRGALMFDRDKLNHVSPKAVAIGALNMLDMVSDESPEAQGVALAAAFLAYARRRSLDVGDLFTVANNIVHSKHRDHPSFVALHLYMQHEI